MDKGMYNSLIAAALLEKAQSSDRTPVITE
jgi:hypothetical protein